MSKTPRQRAFAAELGDWQPANGEIVFVRSRDGHLARVCGKGTVSQQTLFLPGMIEVTLRVGGCRRIDLWSFEDLRPVPAKNNIEQ